MEQDRARTSSLVEGTIANPGPRAPENISPRAGHILARARACGLLSHPKAFFAALLAVFAFGAPAGSAQAVSPQQAAQETGAEEKLETAEDAEEQAEEASTLAMLNPPAPQLSPFQTRLMTAYARHIEYLKGLIAHIREIKKLDQALPHTTTRWLVHRLNKRARIKELRARTRALRVRRAQLLGS
jgi:hypothetical protein